MKKNFLIRNGVEIVWDDQFVDLHNCYDFLLLQFCLEAKSGCLTFEPLSEFTERARPLHLEFLGISYFDARLGCSGEAAKGLDEVGYKEPSDTDVRWLKDEGQSSSSDHMFFRFFEGDYVRIHADAVRCYEGDPAGCDQSR